ncbi:hypothetical protein D0869_07461 [Hortaea werneckii]|uniref:DNA replication complex GINS protein SLD5 n=1 Tax=Hortaea werneckii TaxID=91943 RepID=A0A3M6XQK8_HORWE|nr:hypothetical protein D0869_07461 [Hortaea werneckii]RMX93015.1 hypothetical protein D0868_13088 [Hortaea werneckii]RMY18268.1 hypothetical protein D0867_05443 [Hortaea werneckii]RMY23174.1 hypothetical protein D0866_11740 [Hortaea werneckii]
MDADISDILASVSRPSVPQSTLDLQALTRAWVNERTSPELLPYPAELVDRVMDRVKKQIETIEDMTATMDAKSNFTLVILQTELERFKFLVRSFVRSRIAKVHQTPLLLFSLHALKKTPQKIDKYPHHYRALALEQQAEPTVQPVLSHVEQQYLQQHQSILAGHIHSAFLSSFPSQLQKLDDTAGGISMVDKPDEDGAVFCRVLRDAGEAEIHSEEGTSEVELKRGDVWILRWSAVRDAVVRGDVELI